MRDVLRSMMVPLWSVISSLTDRSMIDAYAAGTGVHAASCDPRSK
jgi:hypothetical protein